ncbi:electron transport complex subunit RsxG [Glaciecola petra]|uniref:Ion-translocating oxidoreductase complex subunit G n=1 Tax=Glaciecola petra TaxID=3075602 RepID=A0ABU2ZR38_9ALTE|nr:electron transport complex subunit RsxG [Aestuariibacter sp. P117]MDT0593917.1 electron transport complex subunit RsxG [Aestuariibacter sp. P117]
MFSHIRKNGLLLGAFALGTTSIIALTYTLTHEKIAQAREQQLLSTLNQVIPKQMHDNDLHLDCLKVPADPLLGEKAQRVFRSRLLENNTAIAIETTAPNGYSGAIDLVVAVNIENSILGVRTINHKETPGLGDKIDHRLSDWIFDFDNKQYSDDTGQRWQVKKDGGQFDQFTGATITPRAVIAAVKNATIYIKQNSTYLYNAQSNCLTTPLTEDKQ